MYRIFITKEFDHCLERVTSRDRVTIEKKISEYMAPQLKLEPHYGTNIKKLKGGGIIIWLKASPAQIRKRIGLDDNRPSLTGKKSFLDEIAEVLKKREPLYRMAADYEINTDGKPVEKVGKEILELIKNEV